MKFEFWFARKPVIIKYLMSPYNGGPKSALFLRVSEIRAGVRRAGVKRAVFWIENSKKSGVNFKISVSSK